MAVFHYVHLRAFAHETEDPARVVAALRHAAQDERVTFEETRVEGSHGNRIVILDGEVKNTAAQKRLFAALARDDPDGFAHVAATIRERVDENLNLHFRLDKQNAFQGRVALATDASREFGRGFTEASFGVDAITVRGKIRSFESKRSGAGVETALPDLEAFIESVRGRSVGQ